MKPELVHGESAEALLGVGGKLVAKAAVGPGPEVTVTVETFGFGVWAADVGVADEGRTANRGDVA